MEKQLFDLLAVPEEVVLLVTDLDRGAAVLLIEHVSISPIFHFGVRAPKDTKK